MFIIDFDPVALSLGPLVIRWYSLAYLAGFLGGWGYARYLTTLYKDGPTKQQIDDFLVWAVLGVILGGRLGYCLFYNVSYFAENPLEILQVWQGGMSFHGGLLGVVVAVCSYAYKYGIPILKLGDIVSAVTPIGLLFGRLANFINGELYGRVTEHPIGMIFPRGGDVPRHPSQLYQAGWEGLALLIILSLMIHRPAIRRQYGVTFGALLTLYGVGRFVIEFTREPDAHIGFLSLGLSLGQWLCLPMIAAGLVLIMWRLTHAKRS